MPLLALLQSIADEPVAKYEWQRSSPLEMGKLCSSEQQTPKVGGEKTGLQSFTNTENPLGTTLAKFWKAKESTQAVYIFAQSFCKGSILIHVCFFCALLIWGSQKGSTRHHQDIWQACHNLVHELWYLWCPSEAWRYLCLPFLQHLLLPPRLS